MVFFGVLPKICLSLIPTERGRFSRCFQKSFVPQKVGSESDRKLRFGWNYFSLHLFPVGEAIWGGVLKKSFVPSKGRQRETRFFTSVLNISSLVPTWRGQKLCLLRNFLPQGVDHEKD